MQKTAIATTPQSPSRRSMAALAHAARRPWVWVALAYVGLALTLALNAPNLTRFLGSLVWTTLGLAFAAWMVIVWRIVIDSTFGRSGSP